MLSLKELFFAMVRGDFKRLMSLVGQRLKEKKALELAAAAYEIMTLSRT